MEKIRLQKFFTDSGVLSRRAAEAEIAAGRVSVNGITAEIGQKIDPENDVVIYNDKQIVYPGAMHRNTYIMLNKPVGYVTTMSDEKGRKTVTELIDSVGTRVYPVGRLDMYSEGLLLLTNDGELTNKLTHPSHNISKTYKLKVKGDIGQAGARAFTLPMTIDGYRLKPVEARLVASGDVTSDGTVTSTLFITLHEGRNRQIRKMCDQLGYTVLMLKRISIGDVKLGALPTGQWRHLTEDEVEHLKNS